MEQAQSGRPARDQARRLSRRACGARLRPCRDQREAGASGRGAGARTVVPHRARRARMGAPLWSGPHRPRPRPRPLSHRRGAKRARCRLGAGRGAEEPGSDRRPGPGRDQGAAHCPPSRPGRKGRAHSLPAALRASRNGLIRDGPARHGLARDPHPLAHRSSGRQRGTLQCGRAGATPLAADAGALPRDRARAELDRGVSS